LSLIKKIVSETAIYGLSSVVGRLLNYLLVPLHTFVFLPNEYGIVGYLFSYAGFLMVTLTYGFETAFFRFSKKQENRQNVFGTSIISYLISNSVFLFFILLFYQNIANWIKLPNNPEYVIWFVLIIIFDVFTSIPFAKLRLESKAIKFATVKIINILINIGLNLFFLLLCPYLLKQNILPEFINKIYNPNIGIGYIFIANLIASAATFFILFPSVFKSKLRFDFSIFKKMFKYAMPLLLVGIAAMINELLSRILLKFYLPGSEDFVNSEIGIYNACIKLAILISLFTQAYKMAVEPLFFTLSDNKNAKNNYAQMMHFYLAFAGFVVLFVFLFLDFFKFFIGNNYWEGLKIVPILLFAYLFLGIYYNLSVWYKVTDKTKFAVVISLVGALFTIIINVLFIPKYSYVASAFAALACYASMVLVSFLWMKKHYNIPYKVKSFFIMMVFLVSVFAFKITFTNQFSNFEYYTFSLIAILVYFVLTNYLFSLKKALKIK